MPNEVPDIHSDREEHDERWSCNAPPLVWRIFQLQWAGVLFAHLDVASWDVAQPPPVQCKHPRAPYLHRTPIEHLDSNTVSARSGPPTSCVIARCQAVCSAPRGSCR